MVSDHRTHQSEFRSPQTRTCVSPSAMPFSIYSLITAVYCLKVEDAMLRLSGTICLIASGGICGLKRSTRARSYRQHWNRSHFRHALSWMLLRTWWSRGLTPVKRWHCSLSRHESQWEGTGQLHRWVTLHRSQTELHRRAYTATPLSCLRVLGMSRSISRGVAGHRSLLA